MARVELPPPKAFFMATAPPAAGGGAIAGVSAFTTAFTTVPLTNLVYSTAGVWTPGTSTWTIPVTGYYDVNATFRLPDVTAAGNSGLQVGIGVDTSNVDSSTFVWQAGTAALRNTFQYTRNAHFNAGDQVRLFVYIDNSPGRNYNAASLSLSLLGAG